MTGDRREFLGAVAAVLGANFARADAKRIRAVAFDGLAVFDARPVAAVAGELFANKAADVMNTWRTRQFEYGWQRTLTRSYADVWQITNDALEFACAAHSVELDAARRERLMSEWLRLPAWPDVLSALRTLKDAGIRMALLSNFSPAMLEANVLHAGLQGFFEASLSTDTVRAYKPDPRSYAMGAGHFRLQRREILFVAFGGWDAVGARRFGYPVYWCNRLAQPAEVLGVAIDRNEPDLAALPAFVGA